MTKPTVSKHRRKSRWWAASLPVQAWMRPLIPRRARIFPQFSDDLFLVVSVYLTIIFSLQKAPATLYGPFYLALSGVTLSLRLHIMPFTTSGALSPHNGAFLPPWGPTPRPGSSGGLFWFWAALAHKMYIRFRGWVLCRTLKFYSDIWLIGFWLCRPRNFREEGKGGKKSQILTLFWPFVSCCRNVLEICNKFVKHQWLPHVFTKFGTVWYFHLDVAKNGYWVARKWD